MSIPKRVLRVIRRRTRLLLEGLKLLLLVAVFSAILDQVSEMREDLYGRGTGVALAQARYRTELDRKQEEIETALRDCAEEISRTKAELSESLAHFDGEREDLGRFLDLRTREMEGSILSRLETERGQLAEARALVENQQAGIQKLSALLTKDPESMKRKMVFPTVQLRGNGTVGSGVIVYSEVQPDVLGAAEPPAATLVLTAYHVVVEVTGDRLERGTVDEVHVLLEDDMDTTQAFSAKLVLFDRPRDIAVLRLNSTRKFRYVAEFTPLEAFKDIDIFARAYAVGCPLGNRPLPTLGEISSKSKVVGDQTFWMLSAPTFFGNSGGGVYLAENCRLIGISSMIYTYGKSHPAVVPHMGLFVPLDTVCRWLDSEGYSFAYERRPIPREMLWKLVYLPQNALVPRAAAGSPEPEFGFRR